MLHLMRVVHVLGGAIWVGCVVFVAYFLVPGSRALGPAAGPLMGYLTQVKKMPQFLLIIGLLTLMSGYWAYWHNYTVYGREWMASRPAMVFGVGAICATVAWFIGLLVSKPLAQKLGAAIAQMGTSGASPSPDLMITIRDIQAKLANASIIVATLLVLAALTMSVARYT